VIELSQEASLEPKIKVIGVGGGGGNAINKMIEVKVEGVEFIAINTDAQDLEKSLASSKIQIGKKTTMGQGAGGNPEIGLRAAEEHREEISQILSGSDMIFVDACMGGGTGTGAAPLISELAAGTGALTVAIVTLPFSAEGNNRMENALMGIDKIRNKVDTLIVIRNDKLLDIADEELTFDDGMTLSNDILLQATRGISEIIRKPGFINIDFADVKSVMKDGGDAIMGSAIASGKERAIEASKKASSNILLDGVSISGATGVVINIVSSRKSLKMTEPNTVVKTIKDEVGENASISFGVYYDDSMGDNLRVTVIATGFNKHLKINKKIQADDLQTTLDIVETPKVQETQKTTVEKIIEEETIEKIPKTDDNSEKEAILQERPQERTENPAQIHIDLDTQMRPRKRDNDFDLTSLTRMKAENRAENQFMLDELEDDDLDVPAFIRRAKD
jgi:cell division protein FtsZ